MTYTSDVRILMGMVGLYGPQSFQFHNINYTPVYGRYQNYNISVSVSFSPKIMLFHDQSLPCASFDSRIFESVTARHGTCEGSEERMECVKIAQKEGCWYVTGKEEG